VAGDEGIVSLAQGKRSRVSKAVTIWRAR